MKKHIIDKKTGIPYTLVGDYYLPWGDLSDDEPEEMFFRLVKQLANISLHQYTIN